MKAFPPRGAQHAPRRAGPPPALLIQSALDPGAHAPTADGRRGAATDGFCLCSSRPAREPSSRSRHLLRPPLPVGALQGIPLQVETRGLIRQAISLPREVGCLTDPPEPRRSPDQSPRTRTTVSHEVRLLNTNLFFFLQ